MAAIPTLRWQPGFALRAILRGQGRSYTLLLHISL